MICFRLRVSNRAHSCLTILVVLLIAPACIAALAQSGEAEDAHMTVASQTASEAIDRQEVFRRIGLYEGYAREADSLHLDNPSRIKIYRNLGVLYDLAGMMSRAEAATERAIEYMKDGPQNELADEYNNLSSIHSLMGNLKQSEKDQFQALTLREKIGDPLGIALTWTDMAGVYYQERQFKKAIQFAQKSYDVLAERTDIDATNHIAVLQTMAFALCDTRQCSRGVSIMEQAVAETRRAYGADSLSAAAQGFALGYIYWKYGDNNDAAEWMRVSLKRMKEDLGWGAPLYVNSMRQYEQFLHKTGQREEVYQAESELHRIQSVVDARTLTTRGAEFLSSGKH